MRKFLWSVSYVMVIAAILMFQSKAMDSSSPEEPWEFDLNGTDLVCEHRPRIDNDRLKKFCLHVKDKKQQFTQLEKLILSKNFIGNEGVETFCKFLKDEDFLPELKEVDFSLNKIDEDGTSYFVPLLKRDKFKYLIIYGNNGAATENGIYNITTALTEDENSGTNSSSIEKYLDKVIWVYKTWINGAVNNKYISSSQAKAHKKYYNLS